MMELEPFSFFLNTFDYRLSLVCLRIGPGCNQTNDVVTEDVLSNQQKKNYEIFFLKPVSAFYNVFHFHFSILIYLFFI